MIAGKGLNPDDFLEKEDGDDVFEAPRSPTLEEKLAEATLTEIDELEVRIGN